MATVADLLLLLRGDTSDIEKKLASTQSGLVSLGKEADGIGSKLERLGPALTSAALALPLAALGGEALHAAEKFETAMRTIQNRTGATEEQLKGLEESFKHVYGATAASSEAAAAALATLSDRSGLTGKALEDLTLKVLTLSRRSGVDVTVLAQDLTKAFGQWGIATQNQSAAMDKLFTVSQRTAIPLDQLTELVQRFSPQLHAMGLNFNEAASLVGRFQAAGVNTENVMVAMSRGIATAAKSGLTGADAISFLVEKVKAAKSPADSLTVAMEEFGKKAGLGVYQAIVAGRFDDFLTGEFKRSANAIDEVAPAVGNWAAQWEKFKHSLELAVLPLGQPLLQALTNSVDGMKPLISGLADAATGFSKLPQSVQLTAIGLAAVGVAAPIAAKGLGLIAEAFNVLKVGQVLSALSVLPGVITNINFAVSTGLTGALTGVEAALLAVGKASPFALLAAGASYLGFKLLETESITNRLADSHAKLTAQLGNTQSATHGLTQAQADSGRAGRDVLELFSHLETQAARVPPTIHLTAEELKKLDEEFKKAQSTLGIKSIAFETQELDKALKVLADSGRLDIRELAAAAEDVRLKVLALRSAVGDEPFKILGIQPATSWQVLGAAMADIRKLAVEGEIPLAKFGEALDALGKKARAEGIDIEVPISGFLKYQFATMDLLAATFLLEKGIEDLDKDMRLAASEAASSGLKTLVTPVALAAASVTTLDGALKELGLKTAKESRLEMDRLTGALATFSAAARVNVPGAANAARTAMNDILDLTAKIASPEPFRALNIQSQASFDILAQKARANFELIRDSKLSSDRDILRATVALGDAEIAQSGHVTSITIAQYERAKAATSGATRQMDSEWRKLGEAINRINADLAHGLADVIVKGGSIGKVFHTAADDIATAIIGRAIAGGTKLLIRDLDGILSKIPLIGKALGSITATGGGGALGTTVGAGGTAASGGVAGLGGAASTAASPAAAAASSSLLGILDAAFAGISAVSGVIGNFQNARQENTLNAIELNTRKGTLYLGDRGDQGILGQLFKVNDILAFGTTAKSVLNIETWAAKIASSTGAGAAGFSGGGTVINGGTFNFEMHIDGTGKDGRQMAEEIMETLKMLSPKFRPR